VDVDSVTWSKDRWTEAGQPEAEHFAAMTAILRLHVVVVGALDRALRAHELSRTGYLIMATLRISQHRTMTITSLGRSLLLHPTTISVAVDQLATRDLLDRRTCPEDRRTVQTSLTGRGTAVMDSVTNALADGHYGLSGVSDRLAITLTEVIRQVRQSLGDQ
jgi:DNA-binding MarR family transcriptional regulator